MTKDSLEDLWIDFETLSSNAMNCAVIDMSAIVTNRDKMLSDKPYTCKDIMLVKKFKLSVADQVKNYKNFVVSPDTVKFWETVSESARNNIVPKKDDLKLTDFCSQFVNFLMSNPKVDYWWSRSNTFDPIILWRMFEATDRINHINAQLQYWRVRDIRTFIDAKFDFKTKNGFCPIADEEFWNSVFVEHDSRWDVIADVLRMQCILRAEHELEQVKR